MNNSPGVARRLLWVSIFSLAFAFVEASVVIYLRALYYPEGFAFPLKLIEHQHLIVELFRETATIVMLIAVGWIAGRSGWERFGYFCVAFGFWDMSFYVWLFFTVGWPTALTEWDILFLIPSPWIGPVVAPILISLFLTVAGTMIVSRLPQKVLFQPRLLSWVLALAGTVILLSSFMWDTRAAQGGSLPQPYRYELLVAGLLLYLGGFVAACKRDRAISL